MQAHMRQVVIGFLRLIVILLALVFGPTNAVSECRFVTQESVFAPTSTLWEFERQCEYPDEATVGRMIYRSNAVYDMVHGQFGCEETSGWPAKSGYVKYNDIDMPQMDDLGLILRYSKNSPPSVSIEIYIDDELRASFVPTRTWDWNTFTSTTRLPLGSVDHGLHSIMFSTEGQRYGVADLDEFALAGYQQFQVFLPLVVKEIATWAESNSYSTTCAEEDNVNVPIFARQISRFEVSATHPTYDIGVDNCEPDFSGCTSTRFQTADTCTQLVADGTNVVHGCNVEGWWRPYSMHIVVGSKSGNYHYLTLYRKVQDQNQWPQFLVLYEDGYMRLKPHPPSGRWDTCFGSSVIIGPAVRSSRPYIDIQEVRVNLSELSLDLTYRNGGTAHVDLSVDQSRTAALTTIDYSTSTTVPFATFRSMYVSNGNADVDHIQTPEGDFHIMTWSGALKGPWWFFHRTVRSIHNTSAPDIRIEVLD